MKEGVKSMKASELRLGNFVYELGHETKTPIVVSNLMQGIYASLINGSREEFFLPITITEEWLVKMGFENEKGVGLLKWPIGCSMSAEGYLMVFDAKNKSQLNGRDHYELFDNDIKYVHQLQNLYFALTGEELIIK